jgi:hypothetical protein
MLREVSGHWGHMFLVICWFEIWNINFYHGIGICSVTSTLTLTCITKDSRRTMWTTCIVNGSKFHYLIKFLWRQSSLLSSCNIRSPAYDSTIQKHCSKYHWFREHLQFGEIEIKSIALQEQISKHIHQANVCWKLRAIAHESFRLLKPFTVKKSNPDFYYHWWFDERASIKNSDKLLPIVIDYLFCLQMIII